MKTLDELPVWAYLIFRRQIQSLYYWDMYAGANRPEDQVFWPFVDCGMSSLRFHHESPWTEKEFDYRFASARGIDEVTFLGFRNTNRIADIPARDQVVVYFELDWIIEGEWKPFQYAFLVVK